MTCRICRGMLKTIVVEDDVAYAVDCPLCTNEALSAKMSLANVPRRYLSVRFKNSRSRGEHSNVLRDCFDWCGDPQSFLTLCGPSGSGKTHTMCCMVAELLSKGIKAKYLSLIDLIDEERRRIGKKSHGELYLLESADVLFVDELGSGIGTDFERDIVHRLVSRRYDDMKPTVFATNYRLRGTSKASLEASGKLNANTMSRISTSRVLELLEDFRGEE